ncbi:MAG: dual specificity protein phosphatase family protein [Haloarculaceae archaeon]
MSSNHPLTYPDPMPHNFAPAAAGEPVAFGACAPGRLSNAPDPQAKWIEFMLDQGTERVLCLLSEDQLALRPGLLEAYRERFPGDVGHVPMTDHHLPTHGEVAEALSFLEAGEAEGSPTVVHCLAGIGRTGVTLAGWLVRARGYDPRAAVTTVEDHRRHPRESVERGNSTEEALLDLLASVG